MGNHGVLGFKARRLRLRWYRERGPEVAPSAPGKSRRAAPTSGDCPRRTGGKRVLADPRPSITPAWSTTTLRRPPSPRVAP